MWVGRLLTLSSSFFLTTKKYNTYHTYTISRWSYCHSNGAEKRGFLQPSIYIQGCSLSTDVHVVEKPVILHTLYEINRPTWLSKYWEILCSKDPDAEIEKAKKDSSLPLFLRTNPFKIKKPHNGRHDIEVGKWVLVPISVSEFDEVEARHFNLGSIDTPEERLVYARDEYELAIDKPKQLSINGHRLLDREGIYGPYYTEVKNFKLTVDKESAQSIKALSMCVYSLSN